MRIGPALALGLVLLSGPDGFRAEAGGSGQVSLAEGAVIRLEDIGGGSVIVTIDAG
jgi:hypothetical protein